MKERSSTRTQKPTSYAARLRKAMSQKGLTIRDLERELGKKDRGFSYEHIRRVLGGLPFMSQSFNEQVCEALDLNADAMWEVAQVEKSRRHPGHGVKIPDARLASIWPELMPSDHERLVKIAEGMAEERRQGRVDEDMSPEQIRERIFELTNRLTDERNKPQHATARRRARN